MQTASPRAAHAIRENGGRASTWVRYGSEVRPLDVQWVDALGPCLQDGDTVLLFNDTLLRAVERQGIAILDLA